MSLWVHPILFLREEMVQRNYPGTPVETVKSCLYKCFKNIWQTIWSSCTFWGAEQITESRLTRNSCSRIRYKANRWDSFSVMNETKSCCLVIRYNCSPFHLCTIQQRSKIIATVFVTQWKVTASVEGCADFKLVGALVPFNCQLTLELAKWNKTKWGVGLKLRSHWRTLLN